MLIVVAVFCRFYSIFQLAGKRYRLLRVCVCLADPGEARRCSVSEPFPPTALRRGHAQTVRDSSSNYKIDYVIAIKNFLNPEGHQNRNNGSKVTALLVTG